ncbi:MAG: hypothetical protein IKC36_05180 [Clostridia bacterium]|nr:hypothetical protein [Clostridia bacterium]
MIVSNSQKIDIGTNVTSAYEGGSLYIRYTKGGAAQIARLSVLTSPARLLKISREGYSGQISVMDDYQVKVSGLDIEVSPR